MAFGLPRIIALCAAIALPAASALAQPSETIVKDQYFRDIPLSQLMVQTACGAIVTLQAALNGGGTCTAAAPTAPTSVTVTAAVGSNTISGTPVTANPAVTGYSVFRGTTAGGESGTAIATNVSLPYTDSAVTAGTTYFYKLKAVNSVGSSPLSTAEGSGTPTSGSTPAAPSAPQTLAAGTITSSSIQWTWQAPATGSPASYTYELDTAPTSTGTWTAASTGISALTFTTTGIAASTLVYARVIATNSTGTGPASAVASATTSAATVNTRARFVQAGATDGATSPAALLASMSIVAGPTSDRNGTMTTTSSPTQYTWVAVTQTAFGSGEHFFDGTGYGGFNGAASSSVYSGADADPTTIHQTYTDGNGTVWYLIRSSGHSTAITFTLS